MRLHTCASTLVAAAAAFGLQSGTALAANDSGPYPFVDHHHVAPSYYLSPRAIETPGSSGDGWLVVLGAAGTVTVAGIGVSAARRRVRSTPSVRSVGAAGRR